jgi:hypothetical protein
LASASSYARAESIADDSEGDSLVAVGRAMALRQAMLADLNDTSSPPNAYPAFCAPFAPIGEEQMI